MPFIFISISSWVNRIFTVKNKKPLTAAYALSRTNKHYPRCHLGSRPSRALLRSTNILPATDACPRVATYLGFPFPCALSGPFDNAFHIRISAPRTLCDGYMAFIPASTVCYEIIHIVNQQAQFVNPFSKNEITLDQTPKSLWWSRVISLNAWVQSLGNLTFYRFTVCFQDEIWITPVRIHILVDCWRFILSGVWGKQRWRFHFFIRNLGCVRSLVSPLCVYILARRNSNCKLG